MVDKRVAPSERISELAEQITDYFMKEKMKTPEWQRDDRIPHKDFGDLKEEDFETWETWMRRRIRSSPVTVTLAITAYLDEQAGTTYDYTNKEVLG